MNTIYTYLIFIYPITILVNQDMGDLFDPSRSDLSVCLRFNRAQKRHPRAFHHVCLSRFHCFSCFHTVRTLWQFNIAIENGPLIHIDTLWQFNIAVENGELIVDLPMKDGGFHGYISLPEGIIHSA